MEKGWSAGGGDGGGGGAGARAAAAATRSGHQETDVNGGKSIPYPTNARSLRVLVFDKRTLDLRSSAAPGILHANFELRR